MPSYYHHHTITQNGYWLRGTWLPQLVKPQTLGFNSYHNLMAVRSSPKVGPVLRKESAPGFSRSLPLPPPPTCVRALSLSFSLSRKNKYINLFFKKIGTNQVNHSDFQHWGLDTIYAEKQSDWSRYFL